MENRHQVIIDTEKCIGCGLCKKDCVGFDIDIVDDSYNEESWTFSQKEWWNINKITTDEKTQAVKDAQTMMKDTAAADTTLLMQAQNRAKLLIENYINQIGKLNKTNYTINWIDVE